MLLMILFLSSNSSALLTSFKSGKSLCLSLIPILSEDEVKLFTKFSSFFPSDLNQLQALFKIMLILF